MPDNTVRRTVRAVAILLAALLAFAALFGCGDGHPGPLRRDTAPGNTPTDSDRDASVLRDAGLAIPVDAGLDAGEDAAAPGSDSDSGPGTPPALCVFDYDLTLSSHLCPETEGQAAYFCRENDCTTYNWTRQCLATDARAAIAECVRRGAYIGISSRSKADACWEDKILPMLTQFPEWSERIGTVVLGGIIAYPPLDVRANWNCDDCAYNMEGGLGKPEGIRRIMRHYGLDPESPADRARVIFWDDTPENIIAVDTELQEARAVLVPRFTDSGADGGCGITKKEIVAGWAP